MKKERKNVTKDKSEDKEIDDKKVEGRNKRCWMKGTKVIEKTIERKEVKRSNE